MICMEQSGLWSLYTYTYSHAGYGGLCPSEPCKDNAREFDGVAPQQSLKVLIWPWDIWYLRISLNVLLASLCVECASYKDCTTGSTGSTRNAGNTWSKSADAMERPSCRERTTGPTNRHSSSLSSASWTQKVTNIPIMSTCQKRDANKFTQILSIGYE